MPSGSAADREDVPSSPVPSDRKLVRALHAAEEPGMRKLIVGMLTKDAWREGDADEEGRAEPAELSEANIKAVLRWTFDIDLRD
jgi:hypothetical protein